jgi:phosphatidylglycerol:prolipoprotein diacylglycerol transferase
MFPDVRILGMSLYEVCFCIGVISALAVFRIVAEKKKASAKIQNFILINGVISIIAGYASAVLFQAIYNYFDTGIFEINMSTGATFLGGLIGGVSVFLIIYFVVGRFYFKEKEHIYFTPWLLSLAGPAIAAAHAFGRLGCFFVGCCYGIEVKGFWGAYMNGKEVLPVQLFESIYLFILATVLLVLQLKKPDFRFGLPIYMTCYGIWRFFIEYLRGDDRGQFIVKFLTPSQFQSVIMVTGGIIMLIVMIKLYGKKKEQIKFDEN